MIYEIALSGGDAIFASPRTKRKTRNPLMPYAIYMLRCSDGTYYTGLTKDLGARVSEHQTGAHPEAYTFSRRPVELVWSEVAKSYRGLFNGSIRLKVGVGQRKKL